ncbi:hypothetical protein [Cupriavidus basilensis]
MTVANRRGPGNEAFVQSICAGASGELQDQFIALMAGHKAEPFIETRLLRLSWRAPDRPKLVSLIAHMELRPSFQQEAALWWEPGVTYATAAEVEWARRKTIYSGPGFSEWASQRAD